MTHILGDFTLLGCIELHNELILLTWATYISMGTDTNVRQSGAMPQQNWRHANRATKLGPASVLLTPWSQRIHNYSTT
jgi:hypothetical protein